MRDLAGHLFVLGVALLAVPLTDLLGPTLTWSIGALCIVVAIYVYYNDEPPASRGTEGDRAELGFVNCPACGTKVPALEDTCEHCGAPL